MVTEQHLVIADGASKGASGPAGWAVMVDGEMYSGKFESATNNQMELFAIWQGLHYVPAGSEVLIWTDSKWGMGWLSSSRPQLSNEILLSLCFSIREIAQLHHLKPWDGPGVPCLWDPWDRVWRARVIHVKGHSDNWLHNQVDREASDQAKQAQLEWLDKVYKVINK